MKVYILIAQNFDGQNIVRVLGSKATAEEFKILLNKLYDTIIKLNEQESEDRHAYWDNHQFITDKNRVLDKYHETESYKKYLVLRKKGYGVLDLVGAPAGCYECVVEEHKVE